MTETITITISPNGEDVKMDAQGFTGGKCEDIIKKISAGVGEVIESKKKPEYYMTESSGIHTGH